jgi:hypothetical protein
VLIYSYILQAEVTQRLSIAKEAANRSATVQSHEDLAKKLKVLYLDNIHFLLMYIHLSGLFTRFTAAMFQDSFGR